MDKYDYQVIKSGVCLNGDSRATEMCDFLKIPHYPNFKINSLSDIWKLYDELDFTECNNCYNSLYENFINFLTINDIKIQSQNSNYIKQPELVNYSNFKENFLANSHMLSLEIKNDVSNLKNDVSNLKNDINNLKKELLSDLRNFELEKQKLPRSIGKILSYLIFKKKNKIHFFEKHVRKY